MKEQQRFLALSSPLKIRLLITSSSLSIWTASNSQKYQEVPAVYPWTHLKGTQHLWKKTKPDKMLPNWPIFRELQMAGHCSESIRGAWITAWCTVLHNRMKRESVICRNDMLKAKRKHQAEEVQRAVESQPTVVSQQKCQPVTQALEV